MTMVCQALGALLFLAPAYRVAAAQDAPPALVGQVRDGETGKPLAGASVMLEGTTMGAMTTAEGFFRIRHGGMRGLVTVRVRRMGYESARDTVTLAPSTTDFGLVFLPPVPPGPLGHRSPVCTPIAQRPDSLRGPPDVEWVRESRRSDGRTELELCRTRVSPDPRASASR